MRTGGAPAVETAGAGGSAVSRGSNLGQGRRLRQSWRLGGALARLEPPHRGAVGSEPLAREAPHLVERDARHALRQRFEMPVAAGDFEERPLMDAPTLVVQIEGERRTHLVKSARHIGFGPGLCRGGRERAEEGGFCGCEAFGLRHRGGEGVDVGVGGGLPIRAHRAREPRGGLVEESARSLRVRPPVPRAAEDGAREPAAAGQERVEEDEGGEVGVGERRRAEGEDDPAVGARSLHRDALRTRRRGLDRAYGRALAGAGQRPEASAHLGQDLFRAHVTRHHEHRVVGLVVTLVESVRVVPGQAFHVRQPADRVVAIRVDLERRGEHRVVEERLGVVVGPQLGEDARALLAEVLGAEGGRGHALGLDVEEMVEPAALQGRRVVGLVDPGVGAGSAALSGDGVGQLVARKLRGAAKGHVLGVVGEAGAAGRLVARADLVGHGHGHEGRAGLFRDQHGQPVVQHVAAHAAQRRRRGGFGETDRERDQHARDQTAGPHTRMRPSARVTAM